MTNGELGQAREIALTRTVLPFYLPFADPGVALRAIDAMLGQSIGSLKFHLGLLTSRFRANHPLRACPVCMEEDFRENSVAYWHIDHQLPGVVVCAEHRVWLNISDIKANGVLRFGWTLPGDSRDLRSTRKDPVPAEAISLARAATALAESSPGQFSDRERIATRYHAALVNRMEGKARSASRLNFTNFANGYAENIAVLRACPGLDGLPGTVLSATAELRRLVRRPESRAHPVRHLAMICWLFSDLKTFAQKCDEANSEAGVCGNQSKNHGSSGTPRDDERKQNLVEMLSAGVTVSRASRMLGIDPATGIAWAAAAGISTKKRPSVIAGEARARMLAALRHGAGKEVVAKVSGASVESVTRLIRTEVGLSEIWKTARFNRAQRKNRARWTRVLARNPNSGPKFARLLEPAAYAWLYRNDLAWLRDEIAKTERATRIARDRVDWDLRDAALAEAVRKAALLLAQDGTARKVRLWQLFQKIPELKAKVGALDRLPLTKGAVTAALAWHQDKQGSLIQHTRKTPTAGKRGAESGKK